MIYFVSDDWVDYIDIGYVYFLTSICIDDDILVASSVKCKDSLEFDSHLTPWVPQG